SLVCCCSIVARGAIWCFLLTLPFCSSLLLSSLLAFFLFDASAPTVVYTLSLHDALPIFRLQPMADVVVVQRQFAEDLFLMGLQLDRKSTRLNSSHGSISYAVFCLKKKSKLEVRAEAQHPSEPSHAFAERNCRRSHIMQAV